MAREDFVDEPEPVGTGDGADLFVPEEQVQVETVEKVEVGGPAGAFAHGPERQFAQPSDFPERPGNLAGPRTVDVETAALDQPLVGGEGADLDLQRRPRDLVDHGGGPGGGHPRE